MLIELVLPFFKSYSMHILCLTSGMKSIVGITGGATRASITHHQAIKDNMAEISAKDGSQETVVNLIGSFVSIFLLNYFTSSVSEWALLLSLMCLHLYTNYLAVKALIFKTFNKQRLALVLRTYFTIGTVLNPYKINEREAVLLGHGLKVKSICGFDVVLCHSLKKALKYYKAVDVKELCDIYMNKNYLLFVCGKNRTIYVSLKNRETTEDVVAAYFHAVCLGIATSIYNTIELDIYSKRQLHHPTPITRLFTYMKSYEKFQNNFRNIPYHYLKSFYEFVNQENAMFFTALRINDNNEIRSVHQGRSFLHNFRGIIDFFKEVLLPYGYPESVSEDYLEYQIWDTLQAFCSTIIGAFTTRAVLKGVGVGDSDANALSATITWILKEGTGMIGRILFAWWKGSGLDCDCKKWRFFADILNDSAMLIELVLPFFKSYSMYILCLTSGMKSIVGITGGATRASITHHQAIKDNMAEISAKDGSQETVVNLIGSVTSIFLLNYFTSSLLKWALILSLMCLHLYTNYLAVKTLIFKTFNKQRIALVLKTYFTIGTVLNPCKINEREAVLLGQGLKVKSICGFDVVLCHSLKEALKYYKAVEVKNLCNIYMDKKYLLLVCSKNKTIYVSLKNRETAADVVAAYFHAVYLGIATSIYNKIELDIYSKRQVHHPTSITTLFTFMESYEKFQNNRKIYIPPLNYFKGFYNLANSETEKFFTALRRNGWSINSHCLAIGKYRVDWENNKKLP
ncbi:RUS1 family protein C16orf58 homolog isoform X2 [Sitophilus oryzae]|nr:RUS1 family protein C16orf58 homolog isoform X2 [Sitophilus oryzae]